MKINRQNNGGESRAIKVLMEQVSDLQTDLAQAQTEIDGLDNSKVSKDELAQSVETQTLSANSANIGSTTIATDHLASNDIRSNELHSVNADFEVEHANTGYIENLTSDALTVNGDESVINLNAQRVTVEDSLTTPNVTTEEIAATNVTASGSVSANSVSAQTVGASTANVATANVSQDLNVNNLNITGEITGLNNVDIVANSIDTPTIDADEITTGSIYTSDVNHLVPSPSLDNNDTYTVQLPVFTGSMFLVWKDNSNNTVWSATVIGDGKNYSIHWSSVGSSLVVTKLCQYNGHAYIKHNANGSLYYSYHTTVKLDDPAVWYNYSALDNIDPDYQHDCTTTSGQISFGDFYAPKFITGGTSMFDDIEVNGTATITNVSAGTVNSDHLVGEELTITDGTTTFMHADENGVAINTDTTLTGDLAQTGDQTVTGEVTISEKESINNVQPDVPGYYVDTDYWEINNIIIDDSGVPQNPSGTKKSSVQVVDSVQPIHWSSTDRYDLCRFEIVNSSTTFEIIKVGNDYYKLGESTTTGHLNYKVTLRFVVDHTYNTSVIITGSNETILTNNTIYQWYQNPGVYWDSTNHQTISSTSNPTVFSELESRTKQSTIALVCKQISWYKIKPTTIGYTKTTNISDSSLNSYPYDELGSDTATDIIYYTPYQTFVAEPDPTHTYDTTTEVLAVNGSENVTRDLRVQGYIFQDDYHLAHLPNILSNDIKVNGSEVLTEASKGVANGVASLGSDGKVPSAQLPTPQAQVNSDWNATSGVAEILNKPTIPTVVDTVADGNMNAVTSNAVYDGVTKINIIDFTQNTTFPSEAISAMCNFDNKMFVGTDQGLYVTSDGTTFTNTSFGAGVTAVIVFNNKLYIGKAGATYEALWETSDGITFTVNTNYGTFMVDEFNIGGIFGISTFGTFGNTLFIGTGDVTQNMGNGIIQTTNGTSFSKFADNDQITITSIIEYKDFGLFVATGGTRNYKVDWVAGNPTYSSISTFDKPVNQFYVFDGALFACCDNRDYGSSSVGLYKSFDGYNYTKFKLPTESSPYATNCIEYFGKLYVSFERGVGCLRQTDAIETVNNPILFRDGKVLHVYNDTLYVSTDSNYRLFAYKIDVSPFVKQLIELFH